MLLKIPLAWLQLARQKVRFIVALAGIAFVVVLMFMQLGFQDALYESATQVHQKLKGDLFIISSQYKALTSQQSFPRSRLYQVLGFEGIESVSPLYVQFAKFKNPQNGEKNPIYVLGVDPASPAFDIPEVTQNLDVVKFPNKVLFDQASRPEFGPIVENFNHNKPVLIEIFPYNGTVGYQVSVGGLFTLGPSFGVDGNLIVNYATILRVFQDRTPGQIDVGLVTLKPGTDVKKMQAALTEILPNDVTVFTRKDYMAFEKDYWSVRTPIGFVFSLMVFMGFIVGVVVVYQILYSNISNHLMEYATLKAMGFKNKYLLDVVFQQALLLALLGYIPGLIISYGLYDVASNATQLPVIMSPNKLLAVLLSATLMCFTSGFFSIGKLRSADPADIF